MRDIAKGSNAFALDLWARVAVHTSGNVVFSPPSISLALAMAWSGAKGETAAQMKKALHFVGDQDTTAAAWGDLARALSAPGRPRELRIANRLFGERSYEFEQPYLDRTATTFAAPLQQLDFKTAFEPARTQINAWVEDQTNERIVGLIPAGALNALTRLVLVNAIYFLADWADRFEAHATTAAPFHLSASSMKSVPTMHRQGAYAIAQLDRVKVLELPYRGNDAAMFVILPNENGGLAALEKTLTAAEVEEWIKPRATALVDVSLPRFELSPPALSLAADLAALGMPLAFDVDADFTGIGNPSAGDARLYISKVFHKGFVKVDEKGTEAAAATAVVMKERGGGPAKAITFKADHPFLFLIVDKTSRLVLFLGRVADPTEN